MSAALLLLMMLEAVFTDLVFTISLKRSTQNLQLSTSCRPITPSLSQTWLFGFVGSMSGLPESGHGWAIYEPLLVAVILTDKLRMHRPLRRRGAGLDSIVLPVRIFPVGLSEPHPGQEA